MNIKKEFIKRFLLGAPFGLIPATLGIVFAGIGVESLTLDTKSYTISVVVSLILAGYLSGISTIYDMDHWGLLKQTSIHLLLVTPFFIPAWYLGWLPRTPFGLIVYFIAWIVIYFIVWNSIRLYFVKIAKELNEGVERFQGDI